MFTVERWRQRIAPQTQRPDQEMWEWLGHFPPEAECCRSWYCRRCNRLVVDHDAEDSPYTPFDWEPCPACAMRMIRLDHLYLKIEHKRREA